MATNYPNSLDSLTNPATTDPVNNPSHAIQHANANDAIEALQAKVGTDNSAVTTSIDYRVRQLELNPVTATANKIEQTVVNGGATTLLKSQVVYASGSVGASGKLRVSLSSNAAESTSTKTFGILAENIIAGGEGLLVSEGLLEGIDTTGAADGDPVFLGSTPGSLLFGLANKPVAPAHLVFLGIVVRGGQANTGSIFVKIQNGFELDELHDVLIVSKTGNDILSYDSNTGLWKNKSFNTLGLATQTYVDTAVQNLSNASDLEYVPIADVGQVDGVASLDSTGNVPLSQLGNLVDGAPTALDTLNELAAALGDNPNYATDITTALGNKVSKSGGSTILPSSASIAGLSFTPATGQTANLLEFIGGPAGGGVKVGPNGNIFDAPAINSNYAFTASAGASGVVPATIKAASGQTANLLEYKHNNGITIGAVRNDGAVMVNTIVPLNSNTGTYASFGSDAIIFNSRSTSTPTTIVKGSASQTANLQEWQVSDGTVIASISKLNSNSNSAYLYISGGSDWKIGSNELHFGRSGGTAYINHPTSFTISSVYGGSLNIKGAVSQTANLQEWQNSSGSVLAYVRNDGLISNPAMLSNYLWLGGFQSGVNLGITPNVLNEKALVIKGLASQTANLTEWQNSSGTVLAKVDATGAMFTTTAAVGTDTTQVATTAFVIDQIDASTQPGSLYQTTAPASPEVGQIWIDSDDDVIVFPYSAPVSISSNSNLTAGARHFVTSASALTLTLPASPALNDEIQILDASGNASTYNITVARNGNKINGGTGNLIIDTNGGWYTLVYTGSTYGWKVG